MRILIVNANYPDAFNIWAPWNERANLAITQIDEIELEIVAPRPFSLPLKYFKYNYFCKIPKKILKNEGLVHYPRFLYMVPKSLFYGFNGNFYKYSVSKYVLNNIAKVDIIHAHHAYLDGYGILKVCKKWNVPLIVDLHSDKTMELWTKGLLLKGHFIDTLNYSSKIICISKKIFIAAKKFGINEKKLEFIPLGVDIQKFKPRNKDKIRKEFNLKEKKIILYVGQLIERKGIYYLLKAISNIEKTLISDCKFVIVGEGPEKNKLFGLTKELNITDKVFFAGKVTEDVLCKWYSLADIFVLPSLSEGRPTVINEAMASECPIIATNVSGIPEQVKVDYNGYLVEPKNSDALSSSIITLIADQKKMLAMGLNSRKRVIDEGWTWADYAQRIYTIYKEITKSPLPHH